MKTLFLSLSLLIVSSFSFASDNYQQFLKLRQKVYQAKQSGLSEVPILNKIDESSRLKKMKIAQNGLNKFLLNRKKFSAFENSLINSILNLDKSSNYSIQKIESGINKEFYTTPFGMKVSVNCFKQIDRSNKTDEVSVTDIEKVDFVDFVYGSYSKKTKELGAINIERKLLEQIGVSIDKMSTCAKNYPSIKPFIEKWMKSLKVTTVNCHDGLAATTGILGTAIPDYIPLVMGKNLYLPPESFLTFITQDSVRNESFSESRNTFIHEVLHLAFADNKEVGEHNSPLLEEVSEDCEEKDRLSDRVYFISNLCTGKTEFVEDDTEYLKSRKVYNYDEIMASKINSCGLKSACLKHFNDPVFCAEVKEMGECKLSSKHQIKAPKNVDENIDQVAKHFENYIRGCINSSRVIRKTGCPSMSYLNRPSNLILKGIFQEFVFGSAKSIRPYLNDYTLIKFLSKHPKTKGYIDQSEWSEILKFLQRNNKSGITKYCREKIDIKNRLKISKSNSCK
tara:strand:+ start:1889 stop:3412 length:1524 start_codon:yes stop_codon:yes gene_type:complete